MHGTGDRGLMTWTTPTPITIKVTLPSSALLAMVIVISSFRGSYCMEGRSRLLLLALFIMTAVLGLGDW